MTTSRDAEIQALTIGEVKPLNGPIVLVDYDPEWPALFRREGARRSTRAPPPCPGWPRSPSWT